MDSNMKQPGNDHVNLKHGDEVEIRIIPDSPVKQIVGVFQIDDIEIIDEIIESDFEGRLLGLVTFKQNRIGWLIDTL